MANVRLVVEYDGTGYSGFQRQAARPTIQGELEAALARLLGEQVNIAAAGRTDAGVHALGQVVNFHTGRAVPPQRLPAALNRLLPRQIVVKQAAQAAEDFHARRMAKARRYQYTILNREQPSALVGRFAYQVADRFDLGAMREAARSLVGERDFAAFQAAGSPSRSTVRRLTTLRVARLADVMIVVLEADSFLYQMARIMVAGLLAVGRGELAAADLRTIADRGDRARIGPPAPPHGLCLVQVRY